MTVFRKSSYCEALNQDQCLEVAGGGGVVLVRDSADPASPVLRIPLAGWTAFVGSL